MSEEDIKKEEAEKKPAAKKAAKKRGRPRGTATARKTAKTKFPTDELGQIDWRAMVPKKYIDLSEDWCRANGIEKSTMTREEIEEKLEEVGDEAKIILLSGFKAVAKARGIQSIKFDPVNIGHEGYAVMKCEIKFVPMSGELNRCQGIANATKDNTAFPFDMYLESMAENRAFIRAVRHGLNINIVGYEEANGKVGTTAAPTSLDDDGGVLSPQDTLRSIVEAKSKTLGDLQNYLNERGVDISKFKGFDDIPGDTCFEIVDLIQKQGK